MTSYVSRVTHRSCTIEQKDAMVDGFEPVRTDLRADLRCCLAAITNKSILDMVA